MKKEDFPLLYNNDIVYLDSAATTQKPKCVIDTISNFYLNNNANIDRGTYDLSVDATNLYNIARNKIKEFINAKDSSEIIVTKNATESLNLLAYSYLDKLKENDEVVLSIMEHHSNLVPWQYVTNKTNSKLKYMYLDNYEIPLSEIENKITSNTKIVSITHVSNVLGVINDIKTIIKKAHSVGAIVILDASQSIPHIKIDVQDLDVDFIVFSSHKILGPLGIGILYGKKELLDNLNPFLMGGDMIEYVYEDHTTFASLPNKFEAGTSNIEGLIGLSSAIDYINNIGYDKINSYEKELTNYAIEKLKELDFVELYLPNNLENHTSVISFNIKNIHSHDVATILNSDKICIRSGNHCAQPLLRYLNINSTCRLSLYVYNTKEDIDKLITSLNKVYNMFKKYIG